MIGVLKAITDIFMMKNEDCVKVGLTQFKRPVVEPVKKNVSIRTKDVKLSDLMRRAS